jgi:flagellar biogenesis protein FliO
VLPQIPLESRLREPRQPSSIPGVLTVKVYQILFLLWLIVFAYWLVGQFKRSNKRMHAEREAKKLTQSSGSSS